MDLALLKKAAIFADLTDEELARVAEVCKAQTFKFGQTIFKEGEPGNRLYMISDGEVRISRQIPGSGEEALTVLKQGACFGEMAVFDRSERSTDSIANIACTLITISRSDFDLLLGGHTHGGQVCLPGGLPLVTHCQNGRRYAAGLWRHGGMVGYTSRGVGVSGLPVRFNSRGELTLITLRRGG